ncbi:MAG: HIT family protein [Candidatus Binatia bacterium]|nr:MAG: HIT family protein [Candidatus Binatia bacterium]
MEPCIFCEIASGKKSAHVVHETESAIAFLDIHPLVDGHTMVVPRRHYRRLADMPDEDVRELFSAVRAVAQKVLQGTGCEDLTIGINDGPSAGQVVPHLHVHLIPRSRGDGGGNVHSIIRRPTRFSLDEMRDRIRVQEARS